MTTIEMIAIGLVVFLLLVVLAALRCKLIGRDSKLETLHLTWATEDGVISVRTKIGEREPLLAKVEPNAPLARGCTQITLYAEPDSKLPSHWSVDPGIYWLDSLLRGVGATPVDPAESDHVTVTLPSILARQLIGRPEAAHHTS